MFCLLIVESPAQLAKISVLNAVFIVYKKAFDSSVANWPHFRLVL
jgi:hypothetical protein